jgi:D-glycero-D-manno-heptose 1,7-bisphosphate phosphatase
VSSGIPAVFLDRDGVLNRAVVRNGRLSPPANLAELDIPPDAPGALKALRTAGFLLVVVTNQPDVARGTQTRDMVEAINAHLLAMLPLDEIRVCYHDDPEDCRCRKPRPGLLLAAAADHGIDLQASFMVGDRLKDLAAGRRAGCRTLLVASDHGIADDGEHAERTVRSLGEAAAWILSQKAGGDRRP